MRAVRAGEGFESTYLKIYGTIEELSLLEKIVHSMDQGTLIRDMRTLVEHERVCECNVCLHAATAFGSNMVRVSGGTGIPVGDLDIGRKIVG